MFWQLTLRRFFNTKPSKRMAPKLPSYLPATAGEPIILDNGCAFIDLKGQQSTSTDKLPPMIKNLGGLVLDQGKVMEMREVRREDPARWTVHQLCKRYNVSRSFVIGQVLSPEERQAYTKEIDDAIAAMSIKQQKGVIIRHKIRADRERSW